MMSYYEDEKEIMLNRIKENEEIFSELKGKRNFEENYIKGMVEKQINHEIDQGLIAGYCTSREVPIKNELDLLINQVESNYKASDELKTIRATLMVNFGSGREGNKLDIGLKNEGTTLSMLMTVLEHLCKDRLNDQV